MLKEALPSGGAERQLALLVKHLPDEWERAVWTMGGGPFVDVIAADGHPVHVSHRRRRVDVLPAVDLWRLLWRWRPDVVHSWDWMSTFAAFPVCAALGIPIVDGTIRNGIARRRRALPLKVARAVSRLIVANSKAGLDAWHVEPVKGRVVYNAFDPERWALCDGVTGAAGHRAGSGGGDGAGSGGGDGRPVTVVMTGRMVPHKDFATLLDAACALDRERPGHWRFELLGDGPDKPALLARAGDLPERGVIALAEPGLEVLPHVREADIGVLLSNEAQHREGCANAIMEYMACGLPVVCTSGGGNPELVVAGETGLLIASGDAAGLADKLRYLDEHDDEARRMGQAGRRRIREDYTVDRYVRGMVRLYTEALS